MGPFLLSGLALGQGPETDQEPAMGTCPTPLLRALRTLAWALCLPLASAQSFEFVALGDLPYGQPEVAYPPYRQLIQAINRQQPVFSIHVGDIKSGSTLCSDEEFEAQRRHFGLFEAGVVYTPGDNEWTDCHRASNGGHDPLERLQALRARFFTPGRSLGQAPIAVQNQSTLQPAHGRTIENQRWVHQGVLFVTLHIVGSNNNLDPRRPQTLAEHQAREQANADWVRAAFEHAGQVSARAIVFAMQANVFESRSWREDFPSHSGFRLSVGQTLLPLAARSGLPVLVIHGDSHGFRFDQPFSLDSQPLKNVTRLEVPGAADVRAVRVGVDLGRTPPFSVSLIERR
jgi:hypothetical protein